jgi:hypothetical protein
MRSTALGVLVVVAMMAGGCAAYHPLRGGVGYTDTPVGPDLVQVAYVGPADMSMTQAREYALLRAAEISVLRNDPFFQVVHEQGYITEGERYVPGENFAYVGGWGGRYHRHPVIFHEWTPGYFEPYSIPEYTMTVRPTAQAGAGAVPANYLIQRAQSRKVKLSPGVAERAAGMPTMAPAELPTLVLPPATQPATTP